LIYIQALIKKTYAQYLTTEEKSMTKTRRKYLDKFP